MIRPLEKQSIQKICSGQVVIDLSTALKELIENSLDARATCIEVKLQDMGADSIEVSDNGVGIEPCNFHSVALKHYTSKLHQFDDLNDLKSFGFRGEALNSLCELSDKFSISTKHSSQPLGSILHFRNDGRLESQTSIVRSTGTTIRVEKLFELLPVRRKEYLRTIKKQFQKALKVIQGYGIISIGVQLSVLNITKSGSRQTLLSTQLSHRIEDNIASVFGMNFLSSLTKFEFNNDHITPSCSSLQTVELVDDGRKLTTFSGFVSRPREGVGRNDSDRQYVFCNGRPVDIPSIPKLFNEMWRKYEMHQKPAFIINIIAPLGTFDINVSPDKREILLTNFSSLIGVETLRGQLDDCFSPSRNTFSLSRQNQAAPPIMPDAQNSSCKLDLKNNTANLVKERRNKKLYDKPVTLLGGAHSSDIFWIFEINLVSQILPLKSIQPCTQSRSAQLDDDPVLKKLSKEDFLYMTILGQFNLGFIVAEIANDIFIFDQHACDEKFRFEMLQQSTTLHRQPLITPRPFATSPFEESIILEHLQLFDMNGFHFIVENSKPPGQKLQLSTLPFSIDVLFDENDVRELVALIESLQSLGRMTTAPFHDSAIPNLVIKNSNIHNISTIRPPRLVAQLASRSCRAAVMIGTSLSLNEMKSIVNNLSSIEQPWNCPHGRPTLRFLADISLFEENRISRKRKFMN